MKVIQLKIILLMLFCVVAFSVQGSPCSTKGKVNMDEFSETYNKYVDSKDYESARNLINCVLKNKTLEKEYKIRLRCLMAGLTFEEGDVAKAEKEYLKLYKKNSDNFYVLTNVALFYYNRGAALFSNALYTDNKDVYLKEKQQYETLFRQAIPYFEQAKEIADNNSSFSSERKLIYTGLRFCYYTLNMHKEFDQIDRAMTELGLH